MLSSLPKKLKISLLALVISAGFVVVNLGLYVKRGVGDAKKNNRNEATVLPAKDTNILLIDNDGDGIPDYYESFYRTDPTNPDTDGDGFLDGEELISGFDPTDADEKIGADRNDVNLTEALAARVVGGIYAGDLKIGNPGIDKDIDLLALATVDDVLKNIKPDFEEVDVVYTSNSREAQNKYLENLAFVFNEEFLTEFMNQGNTMARGAQLLVAGRNDEAYVYFDNLSLAVTKAYSKLLSLPVPPAWENLHKNTLNILKRLATDYSAVRKIEDDPILTMAALQDLSISLGEIEFSILKQIRAKIGSSNLDVPDTYLFQTMGLLNSLNN